VEEGVRQMRGRIARDVDYWVIVGAVAALILAAFVPGPIGILAGIVAGSLVSIAASQYYSKQASRELRREAATLQRETEKVRRDAQLLMRGLEEGEVVKFRENAKGERVGIVIEISAASGGRSDLTIGGDVAHHGDQFESGDNVSDEEGSGD
jgi:hypothetical protein